MRQKFLMLTTVLVIGLIFFIVSPSTATAPTNSTNQTYQKQKISNLTSTTKKGDYLNGSNGVILTFLKNTTPIANYSRTGLQFSNLYTTVYASGPEPQRNLLKYPAVFADGHHAVFDRPKTKMVNHHYFVALLVNTDIKNTTNHTITFTGLAGNPQDRYRVTTGNKTKSIRKSAKIGINDTTANLKLAPKQSVTGKTFRIILASGNSIQQAFAKVPHGHISVKTGGVNGATNDNAHVLKLNLH
ncbi:hypothetical protein BSQ39_07795 [Loigolactobacillus backii]|uniref:hypothetical protein n=1 Tax=Loigolactobacillus backii TaxID=375175 RepID=UPI000C1CA0BC|nr:hypothetical protein [Loigolactobacillus backii]PIO83468.1 hypothetical protein BSQ39_07795 [Loigolactobacillus backii]